MLVVDLSRSSAVRSRSGGLTGPHSAPSVLSLPAAIVVGEQCWQYSLSRQVRTPVEQLQPFERGRIVGLREAGWPYRRIAALVGHKVSVVCRCFQKWSAG